MKILTILVYFLVWVNLDENVDESSYSILFSVTNAGFDVEGKIQLQEAEIRFDPANLRSSYIYATADPSTIKTGISIRDKHLKRSDYLDVGTYPQITLRSKAFRKKGRENFVGRFDLTIKGVTKAITIPLTRKKDNKIVRYEARFEINRIDFSIGAESLTLADVVNITVTAHVPNP
jgi:polyisoprenoid-binding protein YceI